MKVKALISFSGQISMTEGEIADIRDPAIAEDLIRSKYVEEVKEHENQSADPKSKKRK